MTLCTVRLHIGSAKVATVGPMHRGLGISYQYTSGLGGGVTCDRVDPDGETGRGRLDDGGSAAGSAMS